MEFLVYIIKIICLNIKLDKYNIFVKKEIKKRGHIKIKYVKLSTMNILRSL